MPLTAFFGVPVVADEDLLRVGPKEAGPVDSVVVAQLAVVGDVDVTGADLPQGLEPEGGDPLLLQHQQRDATATYIQHRQERVNGWVGRRAGRQAGSAGNKNKGH